VVLGSSNPHVPHVPMPEMNGKLLWTCLSPDMKVHSNLEQKNQPVRTQDLTNCKMPERPGERLCIEST
jgi:hypothetical protein